MNIKGVVLVATIAIVHSLLAALTSADYVQKGLVMQLDGIENTARGAAHDSTATVWKDLAGSLDFTLQSGGSWNEKGLDYSGLAAQAAANPTAYLTVEAHVRNDSGWIVFSSYDTSRWIIQESAKNAVQFCSGTTLWLPMANYGVEATWAATYSGSAPNAVALDGAFVTGTSLNDNWSTRPTVAMIGNRSATETTYKAAGCLYALRFYSRALTAAELAINAAVDRVRFQGSDPATESWPDGVRYVNDRIEYRTDVTVNDADRGTLSAASGWGAIGETFSVTATPKAGYDFSYWTDSTGAILERNRTFTGTISFFGSYTAVFVPVHYVTPDGTGSGASWVDPANAVDAFANAEAGDSFHFAAGNYAVSTEKELTLTNAVLIRGGYEIGSAVTDAPTGETVFHSGYTNFLLTASTGTYLFDHVVISNALFRGATKYGAASLEFYNGGIVYNGRMSTAVLPTTVGIIGRGSLIGGSTASSLLTMTNTLIKGNVDIRGTANRDNRGYGLYVYSFNRVRMNDCLFFNNGTAEDSHGTAWGRDNSRGWAMFVSNAPIAMTNCHFRANRGPSNAAGWDEGALALDGWCTDSVFSHCSWVGNSAEGGAKTAPGGVVEIGYQGNVSYTFLFDHCTFAYNLANRGYTAGILVNNGAVTVRNSIFHGNIIPSDSGLATAFYLKNKSTMNIDYSLLPGNSYDYAKESGATVTVGENMTYGSADFATSDDEVLAMMKSSANTAVAIPASDYSFYFTNLNDIAKIDVHLRSAKGRWNGSAWVKDATFSPAIDVGSGDYALEPSPNGGIANLGIYGNTPEASKSQADVVPEIDSLSVENGTYYTRPHLSLTLKEQEDVFAASVTIYMGATAQEGTEGWDRSYTFPDAIGPGGSINQDLRWFFESGSTVYWKVVVATATKSDTRTGSLVIAGENPPGWGLGGGKDVIHVKVGAIGSGEGDSWVDAVGTIDAANALASGSRTNVWIAGTVPAEIAGSSFSCAVRVLGGFVGTECSDGERVEGARSTVDGEFTSRNNMAFSHATGMTHVERLNFTRSKIESFYKTGAGDIGFYDCRSFANARPNGDAVTSGRGGYLSGSASASVLIISNCTFDANWSTLTSQYPQNGMGLYFTGFKRAELTDVLFATNGFSNTDCARNGYVGAALYASWSKIIANNVRFIGNRGTCHGGDADYIDLTGSIVYLASGCGGSVFSNCLWLANQAPKNGVNNFSHLAGALVVNQASATDTVTVERCTFAYNLAGGRSAGVCVKTGVVKVRNSLFWGNSCSQEACGVDLYCRNSDSKIDADYTLIGNVEDKPYVGVYPGLESSLVTLGEHMVYGDPLFVTETNTVLGAMVVSCQTAAPDIPVWQGSGGIEYLNATPFATWSAHVRGRGGYTDEFTGERYAERVVSPAINAGDPAADATREPDPPAHRRLNLGYYANTPWATAYGVPLPLMLIFR